MHVCSWCMKDWVGVIISWLISTNRKFVHQCIDCKFAYLATWRNTNLHTTVEDYNVHDYKLYTFIDFKFVCLCRGFQICVLIPFIDRCKQDHYHCNYPREQSLPECCCVLWEPWDLAKVFGEDIEIAWMEGTYRVAHLSSDTITRTMRYLSDITR